ncbi:MAG: response regulator receiver protein [Atopobiaceae bacterium]|nr:response regulator receiver protein [Atopobiaceae bacterium]
MSFDPRREDYQRLGLRFARELDGSDPATAVHAFSSFGRRFASMRDTLPQSDADRAFHLVADAAVMVDYQLPFAPDEQVDGLVGRAQALLDEAVALDGGCYDAVRMRFAGTRPSFERSYDFLSERAPEVLAACRAQAEAAAADSFPDRARLGSDIAMRPYWRWMANLAEKALICGRNRACIKLAHELLELDPSDSADVRFTCALAYAKLEDEQGLDAFAAKNAALERGIGAEDAWMLLSRCALAYKRRDFDGARTQLRRIIDGYPHAALNLMDQKELPEGVFSRLAVGPGTEDELMLAISEATVLLLDGRYPFGAWVEEEARRFATPQDLAELETSKKERR